MCCEHCECYDCREARRAREDKERALNLCKSWNWNLHGIEVAQQINKIEEEDEEFAEILLETVKEFFGEKDYEYIVDAMPYA